MIQELGKLEALLWEQWDPIGVRGIAPDDEYNSYARHIWSMLMGGKTEEDVAAYLRWVATENMGLSNAGDCDIVAREALVIHRSFQ